MAKDAIQISHVFTQTLCFLPKNSDSDLSTLVPKKDIFCLKDGQKFMLLLLFFFCAGMQHNIDQAFIVTEPTASNLESLAFLGRCLALLVSATHRAVSFSRL